jgi:hypothetical protein
MNSLNPYFFPPGNRGSDQIKSVMSKDNIIQFVGFVTQMNITEFLRDWEHYSEECTSIPGTTILHREVETKSRFQFISRHTFSEPELSFAFMKNRAKKSRFFKEQQTIKVVQTGGYLPVQMGCRYDNNDDTKIIAFVGHNVSDLEYFRELPGYKYMNIYQQYYENCMYEHVLEIFSSEKEAPELLQQLRSIRGVEAAVYQECVTANT